MFIYELSGCGLDPVAVIKVFPFEINLRKQKWLLISICCPSSQNSESFINNLATITDSFACSYDNILIMGDFNMEPTGPFLISFCDSYSLINLIKSNTYFKGIGSCIHLILTNRKYSFKNTRLFETGLNDHLHMIYKIQAVARRCSVKMVFLKILQNSKETPTQVFSFKFCEIIKNTFS